MQKASTTSLRAAIDAPPSDRRAARGAPRGAGARRGTPAATCGVARAPRGAATLPSPGEPAGGRGAPAPESAPALNDSTAATAATTTNALFIHPLRPSEGV